MIDLLFMFFNCLCPRPGAVLVDLSPYRLRLCLQSRDFKDLGNSKKGKSENAVYFNQYNNKISTEKSHSIATVLPSSIKRHKHPSEAAKKTIKGLEHSISDPNKPIHGLYPHSHRRPCSAIWVRKIAY